MDRTVTTTLQGLFAGILENLWFQLSRLLTVAIASSFLFARFKQPNVIGSSLLRRIMKDATSAGPHACETS